MRILHTSDWHLGRKLKEHDRSEEFRKFFEWLENVTCHENPDALIVSGDVFNNFNPLVEAQEMYYTFLGKIAGKSCRNIIIISGNHDSAPFIDAPAEIMRRCNIHVIGCACENEIITLNDSQRKPEMIVCAVPFLHDGDVRTVRAEDTFAEIEREIKAGIMRHYAGIFERAREIRGESEIPIIATGHLFLEAGKTQIGEGKHATYLGTAIKVGTDIFPEDIAYVALGHLHSPQKVGRGNIRYSGSPIAMTFGECETQKSVSIVDFDGRNFAGVKEIPVPVWQKMARVAGDMAEIERRLRELGGLKESVWAEVAYTGRESPGNLQDRIDEIVKGCQNVEVLSVVDDGQYMEHNKEFVGRKLEDISLEKMFDHLMNTRNVSAEKRELFKKMYFEIIGSVNAEL
ncbi:MAG: exonuclease SbcCD subunit D C-terminal domain-containing protein [Synergistaceae bacterium]|nr:exonuclease SbcCD subunit D C-terminal domain-containing protein [Synergistaceae bacterium]